MTPIPLSLTIGGHYRNLLFGVVKLMTKGLVLVR